MQVLVDEESNWLRHTGVTSEGDCQNRTNGEGESIFLGKNGYQTQSGEPMQHIRLKFYGNFNHFPCQFLSCSTFNEMVQLKLIVKNLILATRN